MHKMRLSLLKSIRGPANAFLASVTDEAILARVLYLRSMAGLAAHYAYPLLSHGDAAAGGGMAFSRPTLSETCSPGQPPATLLKFIATGRLPGIGGLGPLEQAAAAAAAKGHQQSLNAAMAPVSPPSARRMKTEAETRVAAETGSGTRGRGTASSAATPATKGIMPDRGVVPWAAHGPDAEMESAQRALLAVQLSSGGLNHGSGSGISVSVLPGDSVSAMLCVSPVGDAGDSLRAERWLMSSTGLAG